MRWTWTIAAVAGCLGCSGNTPTPPVAPTIPAPVPVSVAVPSRPQPPIREDFEFRSEAEELAYLTSLANPTPIQWRRRNELKEKEEEAVARAEAAYQAKRPKMLRAEAAKHRREGKPNAAIAKLREIVEKYPNSPEAEGSPGLIDECKAEARAMYEAEKARGPK
jgi:hypothetical protein